MKPDLTPLRAGDPKEFDGWNLKGIIGEGGFSTIYLAEKNLQQAALKMIKKENLHDQMAVERFFTEIKNLELLNHPNIARYVESNTSTGVPYFAVEYIEGVSLEKFVESNGPISGAKWFELALSLAETLNYCHAKEIIHKDVSPGNIVMGKKGPVFIDFGLSYLEKDPRLTSVELTVGTPPFMSPEQFGNERTNAMDVFSLAGTLIYAATGHYPFAGSSKQEWQDSISFHKPNFELLSEDQIKFLTPLLYKASADRMGLPLFIAILRDHLGIEQLSTLNAKNFRTHSKDAELKLLKTKKLGELRKSKSNSGLRNLAISAATSALVIVVGVNLLSGSESTTKKSGTSAVATPSASPTQPESKTAGTIKSPTPGVKKNPKAPLSPSVTANASQKPIPIPSSTAFSVSLPVSKNVVTESIFGRVFKSGIDWLIPLAPFSTDAVPPITGVQFRLIGYPNAGWLGVPYILKKSDGGVYAKVDDLLFAVLFKKEVCPEFRFIQESGGEIIKIWNKQEPECATNYVP